MGNEIINEAINRIAIEKETIKQQEIDKLQCDLINPKFVTFENEFAQSLDDENRRHENAIASLQSLLDTKKKAFIENVRLSLEEELEKKHRFNYKIAELKKLLDNEA